jgi:hypothetical protein
MEAIHKWKPSGRTIEVAKIVFLYTWAEIISSRGREKTRDERWPTGCVVAALFLAKLSEEIAKTECWPATTEERRLMLNRARKGVPYHAATRILLHPC